MIQNDPEAGKEMLLKLEGVDDVEYDIPTFGERADKIILSTDGGKVEIDLTEEGGYDKIKEQLMERTGKRYQVTVKDSGGVGSKYNK